MSTAPVLVARLDSDGDVLICGPAIRAVAAVAPVVLLCGPRGAAAARLLPGVAETLIWRCPWIDPEPPPVDGVDIQALLARVRHLSPAAALILTSYHQSPLPLALLLRMAGVAGIAAHSEDYPGSLLDVRHQLPASGLHEAQRMLAVAAAAGYPLPVGDPGRLAVRRPLPDTRALTGDRPYVVLHPGASVPARAPSPQRAASIAAGLVQAGRRVVVTGGPGERELTARVAAAGRRAGGCLDASREAAPSARSSLAGGCVDLGGRTDLAGLADVLDRAEAVVVGNTGPAHLAAAVGTPVVSLFAPTVPAERWAPYGVPSILLGDQQAQCASSRARSCPVPGHPCLDGVPVAAVVEAVARLTARASRPVPDRRGAA